MSNLSSRPRSMRNPLFVLGFAFIAIFGPDLVNSRGWLNQRKCKTVPKGSSLEDLEKLFGKAHVVQDDRKGIMRYRYESPLFSARFIEADFSMTSGKIITLWCAEEHSPPIWEDSE